MTTAALQRYHLALQIRILVKESYNGKIASALQKFGIGAGRWALTAPLSGMGIHLVYTQRHLSDCEYLSRLTF